MRSRREICRTTVRVCLLESRTRGPEGGQRGQQGVRGGYCETKARVNVRRLLWRADGLKASDPTCYWVCGRRRRRTTSEDVGELAGLGGVGWTLESLPRAKPSKAEATRAPGPSLTQAGTCPLFHLFHRNRVSHARHAVICNWPSAFIASPLPWEPCEHWEKGSPAAGRFHDSSAQRTVCTIGRQFSVIFLGPNASKPTAASYSPRRIPHPPVSVVYARRPATGTLGSTVSLTEDNRHRTSKRVWTVSAPVSDSATMTSEALG